MSGKVRVLVVGCGGIGTVAALNLHLGGACHVTMVLRSSYQKVLEHGFRIDSFDHGIIEGWRPDTGESSLGNTYLPATQRLTFTQFYKRHHLFPQIIPPDILISSSVLLKISLTSRPR